MKRCYNERCGYFKENGVCHPACLNRGIKRVITNYDRIKAMSHKELAQFLMGIRCDNHGIAVIDGKLFFKAADFIEWLNREVEE